MNPLPQLLALTLAATLSVQAGIGFERQVLTAHFHSEGACTADIDADGHPDVVSGPFWYAGPDFKQRFAYSPPKKRFVIKSYSDHFFSFSADFNRDGHPDILVVPMPGTPAHWFANPGSDAARSNAGWPKHEVLSAVDNESPTLTDLTGDGSPELVCIHNGAFGYAAPDPNDPTKPWPFTPVTENRNLGRFTHGLGVGDVDGDGRKDLIETQGWWQQGADPTKRFTFHPQKFAGAGGAQMFAYDFDGDGDNDVISSQNAHAYGLAWFEQTKDDDGKITFTRHHILTGDPADSPHDITISQMHALALADIDGDGVHDLVTGKRYFAHNGNDPGAHDLPVVYAFRTVRKNQTATFEPWLADKTAGVGTQLHVADLDADKKPDLVIGNKQGTSILFNRSTPATQVTAKPQTHTTTPVSAFKNHVRPTDALTPGQERDSFTVPPGFHVDLIASEPQIAKPLNLAFDTRGRLWVTNTVEYPYPAPAGKPARDTVKVLEDADRDGSYEKVTTFADNLNIPIGLLPYKNGAFVFSIPDILFLEDTDGDGYSDKRTKILGPFDTTRDTHGMVNSFVRGTDGWIYACHGFNNQSTVAGTDGHEITMQSGNTFRFRPDGSRVEHVTRGQVNPFGMTTDAYGDFFTADCHTKPVTLLLPGGSYESFGKPHDGLGFVPNVMEHLHGSTAIGGITTGDATNFPTEYQDSAFGGDVTSCRVHRDSIIRTGASVRAEEEPPLLVSSDPWFRPVDLRAGPDGALYVADFYNKIIGHYEVPLDHPGRDRTSGRIWRISYGKPKTSTDLSKLTVEETVARLASPHRTQAQNALFHLIDHHGTTATTTVRRALTSKNPQARHLALAALHQLGAALTNDFTRALADPSPIVRSNTTALLTDHRHITTALGDKNPIVQRFATTAATRHPHQTLIRPLLRLATTSKNDRHLHHATRIALRDHLSDDQWFLTLTGNSLPAAQTATVIDIALALSSPAAANFLVQNLDAIPTDNPEILITTLRTAARHIEPDAVPTVVAIARKSFADNQDLQRDILTSVRTGLEQRGIATPTTAEKSWALDLATALLDSTADTPTNTIPWSLAPPAKPPVWSPSDRRNASDGQQNVTLWSSFPNGEQRTGTFRSAPFTLTDTLSFYLAGHDGFPDKPVQNKNHVRLRDVETNTVLFTATPPRNDNAQKISWDTTAHAGTRAVLELTDNDDAAAYAWLAVGRFSNPALNPTRAPEIRRQAAGIATRFGLAGLRPRLTKLLLESTSDRQTATALAAAVISFSPSATLDTLAKTLAHTADPVASISAIANSSDPSTALASAFAIAGPAARLDYASTLAADHAGATRLIDLIHSGNTQARLLQQPAVAQKISRHPGLVNRAEALTAELPADDTRVSDAIASAVRNHRQKPGDPQAGQTVFATACAVCHKIAGTGADLGPNLDGIGSRGLDRLAEDILAPNRNVDINFRASVFVTHDGQTIVGFLRRTEGESLVIADTTGRESTLQKSAIRSQQTLPTSLMPATFADTLTPQQLNDLLSFLLR
ncbi:MAG: FG-GAP-like repeat-containing protein [Verrucomicrobiales bacterium]|nr:FG-GAP-like repeat-containing protein [Verrucomicrobiales bacterium]